MLKNNNKITGDLKQVLIGMIISDGTVLLSGKYALVKIEQGKNQEHFVKHLFDLLKDYTFKSEYSKRYDKKGNIKSFYFKTYTHPEFLSLYNLFYKEGKKVIPKGFILKYIDTISLAY